MVLVRFSFTTVRDWFGLLLRRPIFRRRNNGDWYINVPTIHSARKLKWYYDQILTPWFLRCITWNFMEDILWRYLCFQRVCKICKKQHTLFQSPIHLISMCWWFLARKTLNEAANSSEHIYILAGSNIRGTISKYQNVTLKLARKAFNIREVWNTVCCHGNKNPAYLCSSWVIKIWLRVWRHQLANVQILKSWISLE